MPCIANVMPTEILQIWAQASSGKNAEAQQAQQRLNNFSQSVRIGLCKSPFFMVILFLEQT